MSRSEKPVLLGVYADMDMIRDTTLPKGCIAIVSGGKRTLFRLDLEAETATFVGEERWPLNAKAADEVDERKPHVVVDQVDYGNGIRFTYSNGQEGGAEVRAVYFLGAAYDTKPIPAWLRAYLLGQQLPFIATA